MTQIFISYRRDDVEHFAHNIYRSLVSEFGDEAIFFDQDHIKYGNDFRDDIQVAANLCEVMLVVIGQSWGGINPDGTRRIDNPKDWVRREVEIGLLRSETANVKVIPLLPSDKFMPKEDQLPDSLKELAFCHGMAIPSQEFDSKIQLLIKQLKEDGIRSTNEHTTQPSNRLLRENRGCRFNIDVAIVVAFMTLIGSVLVALINNGFFDKINLGNSSVTSEVAIAMHSGIPLSDRDVRGNQISTLNAQQRVEIIGISPGGDYLYVRLHDGTEGWVQNSDVFFDFEGDIDSLSEVDTTGTAVSFFNTQDANIGATQVALDAQATQTAEYTPAPPTYTPSVTDTPSNTPTNTPTNTLTSTSTSTLTPTLTNTPSITPTPTLTNTSTPTATDTPSDATLTAEATISYLMTETVPCGDMRCQTNYITASEAGEDQLTWEFAMDYCQSIGGQLITQDQWSDVFRQAQEDGTATIVYDRGEWVCDGFESQCASPQIGSDYSAYYYFPNPQEPRERYIEGAIDATLTNIVSITNNLPVFRCAFPEP